MLHQSFTMSRSIKDAGYIEAAVTYYRNGGGRALIKRITWEGHEYLDLVRDDTVWTRTKSKVAETVGTASLEIVKAVAGDAVKGMRGLT